MLVFPRLLSLECDQSRAARFASVSDTWKVEFSVSTGMLPAYASEPYPSPHKLLKSCIRYMYSYILLQDNLVVS